MIGSEKNQGPASPPPTAHSVLSQVASKLRRAGARVPVPVEIGTPTIEGSMKSGLSIALCLVETELDTLAAAAPRDNAVHRALFSLPPIQSSASTAVAMPAMPPQQVVTGDAEVDALLWLREVIGTGNADLIAKAKEAATRITTPLKALEKRYVDWIHRTKPGNFGALLSSLRLSDLNGLAATSIQRATRQHEAQARFGDNLFGDTPAERFCDETLASIVGADGRAPAVDVDMMFDTHHEQRPGTLMDCLLELTFWRELYWLRNAKEGEFWDYSAAVSARDDYVFRMLSRIPPRDPVEAASVLCYLTENDGMDRAQTQAILLNLVGAPEPYRPHEYGDAQ